MSDAQTVMDRCDILATFSEEPDMLTRPFASGAMRRAHEHVSRWMTEAGLTRVGRDNVGNLRGRYDAASPGAPTLILGSHLDSVRNAGRYDGPLGVMVAIAAVQRLHDKKLRLPFAIEVVAFADEEGLRFASTYLGSRALAGAFDMADLERTDASGITMAEAIHSFGGDPTRIGDDRWRGGELLGYCEVHIEQGPGLEARGLPVGVVSVITGQNRYALTFAGVAGHAGTVPMGQRHDALAAAAEFVLEVEREARGRPGLVATVGQLQVQPGAVNVIPGQADLSLDVRHPEDATRAGAAEQILERANAIANRRKVAVAIELISENVSVPCSSRLIARLSEAVAGLGHEVVQLPSGAGHDGVTMSKLTEVAMLFVRCKGGVSHNPAESVAAEDVGVAMDVLDKFLELAR